MKTTMRSVIVFLAVLIVPLVVNADTQPSPSTCTYHCPTSDTAGFPLGQLDESSDPIFCSYPAFQGEDPNDFYCTYSKVSILYFTILTPI